MAGPGQPLRSSDPAQIGPYVLTARLGAGGQGVVYLATTPQGERIAVKLLRSELAEDATARRRFVKEVRAAQRVAPFCTAAVVGFDLQHEPPYIVSEYIDGPSLQERLTADGPIRGDALDEVAASTAAAVAAIHHAGIVHRDLKPSNVLLGPSGPRVVDFGISRALDATATLSGELLGSPAYMAPEQFAPGANSSLAIGPACDVWAWAATMAYAATGRPPFGRDTPAAVMHRVLSDPPELGPMPDHLREVVLACLAKAPADRPTAREVLQRLGAGPGAQLRPDRRRALLIALVVLALVVGGVLTFLSFRTPGHDPRAEPNRPSTASPSPTPSAPAVRRPRAGPLQGTRTRLLAESDGPVALTAYSRRVTDFFGNPTYLWDPDAGRYERQKDMLRASLISPDGRWVAELPQLRTGASLRLVDRISGASTRVSLPKALYHNLRWSSDGRRLLVSAIIKTPSRNGYVIIDVERPPTRAQLIRRTGSVFFWAGDDLITNDGDDVVISNPRGREKRRLRGVGKLAENGFGPLSPDGGRLLTYCSEKPAKACVLSARDGTIRRSRGFSAEGKRPRNAVLGWYDNERYLMSSSAGPGTWDVILASVDRRDRGAIRTLATGPDDTWFLFSPIPPA